MKTIFAIAFAAMFAASAYAHNYSEHGNITLLVPDQAGTAGLALIESVAPGAVPNGVVYYTVRGVEGGDTFTLVADDGQEPFVIGTADECPGPSGTLGRARDAALAGNPNEAARLLLEEFWLLCNNHPDFDIAFTGGNYGNGPGDETGPVPADGDAVVNLFFGDAGEGFTYSES